MLVFLDANALMQDPTCSGTVWHVLAHAPDGWNLRLVTSEVAVAEAVAGYGRRVDLELAKLEKLSGSWGPLGVIDVAGLAKDALAERVAGYRDGLESSLAAAGVEVLAAPDVPHMDVVSRSVARRRPCDEKGDGYRDTLIWFSVLLAAREHPDEVVLLVTNDSDFMDDDRHGFHEDLVDDLSQIDATGRVRLVQVLADVALELAGSAPERSDLRKLKSDLKDETVRHFVATLQPELRDRSLDPKECALPRLTRASILGDTGPIEGFRYELKGGLTQDEAVAEFSFEAHSRVVLSMPAGITPDDYEAVLPTGDEGSVLYAIAKPLVFRGIIRLGRYDRPLGGEITRVLARSDDPGHGEWRIRPSGGQYNSLADVMKNMNVNPLADVMKNINVNPLADVMKNINVNPLADIKPSSQTAREATEDDDPVDVEIDEPVDSVPEDDDTDEESEPSDRTP